MHKKTIIISGGILIVVLIAWLLNATKQKNVPEPLQQVTVLLDWFPNTNHTGLYVAKGMGYYRDHGLEVEIVQPGEGSADQLVAAGKADFAISSQEAVTLARAAGIPIVSIAAVIQHNTSAFAALKKSGIATVKDFEGKRYGGWGSPIEEAMLAAVMGDAGADYKKIKNMTIGTVDFFTMIGRESDFQWIFYAWDGVEAERRGIELNVIMLKDLNPIFDYYTPVIITNEKNITDQGDLVRKFMNATQEGYRFAGEYPHAAAEVVIEAVPEINADLVRESQVWLSPRYQDDAEYWGMQRTETWEQYAQWLWKQGLVQQKIDAVKAFTNVFVAPTPDE